MGWDADRRSQESAMSYGMSLTAKNIRVPIRLEIVSKPGPVIGAQKLLQRRFVESIAVKDCNELPQIRIPHGDRLKEDLQPVSLPADFLNTTDSTQPGEESIFVARREEYGAPDLQRRGSLHHPTPVPFDLMIFISSVASVSAYSLTSNTIGWRPRHLVSPATPRLTCRPGARSAGRGSKPPARRFLRRPPPRLPDGLPISGDSREKAAVGADADNGNPRLGRWKHKHDAVLRLRERVFDTTPTSPNLPLRVG